MLNTDKLRDYLTADPLNLGLSALWPLHDDTAVANLLNDKSKGGPVLLKTVPRAAVASAILADPAHLTNFAAHLPFLQMVEDVPVSMIATHLPHLTARPGSPIEVAFGEGERVEPWQVSAAAPLTVQAARDAEAAAAAAKWKADTTAELTVKARELLASAVDNVLGHMTPFHKFIPDTGPFAVGLQTLWEAKGFVNPTDEEIAPLVELEMMRIGGGA